jgi:hypothetical protein
MKKTPNNFWKNKSKEEILNKAREYKTQSDFQKHCNGAYNIAKESDWLKEVFEIRRKLTYDVCKNEVSKYKSYSELYNGDPSVLSKIDKNGWNDLIDHFEIPFTKKNPKWTYETCKEEISKMKYLNELQGHSVLNVIKRNGWYEELTKNLIRQQNKPYTYDEILNEALKYNTRGEFQKKSHSIYSVALRRNIVDDICKHMGKSLKEKKHTKEEILESSKKYQNQRDWLNNEPNIFTCASGYRKYDKEFWEKCISHMEYIFKPNGYWTYERCKEITDQLNTFSELNNPEYSSIYNAIKRNGWNDLLEHLEQDYRPKGFWNYENCKEEALKFNNRSDFSTAKNGSASAYQTIMKNGWLELLSHMKPKATLKERIIYCYEFTENKTAYVGLTYNIKRRHKAHSGLEKRYGKITSSVYHFSQKTGETPKLVILTKSKITEEEAPKIEGFYIEIYRKNGWTLLNKAKAGSLGGGFRKWTKKNIKKITDECKTDSELRKKLPSWVIDSMKKNNWWDELTSHLIYDGLTNWTHEKVMEILPYVISISDLQKKYAGAHKYINRNPELLNKIKEHFKSLEKVYTKDDVIEIVKSFTGISYLKSKHSKLYNLSVKNGWLDELKTYLKPLVKKRKKIQRNTIWTYEKCKEVALMYNKRTDLEKNECACHRKIYKKGWLELLSHMQPQISKPNSGEYLGKYTIDVLKEISKQYKYRSEFQDKVSGAYKAAKKLGILDELFPKKSEQHK